MASNFIEGIKGMIEKNKQENERKRVEEDSRQQSIRNGDLPVLTVSINLEPGENAYAQFTATRKALIEHVQEVTKGTSKKQGTLGRAVVGGILLGPLGALAGAATAGSKVDTTVTQVKTKSTDVIDSGTLYLTSKRILFVGKQIISLPYVEIVSCNVSKVSFSSEYQLDLKYAAGLEGEHFLLLGNQAKDAALYLQGITKTPQSLNSTVV